MRVYSAFVSFKTYLILVAVCLCFLLFYKPYEKLKRIDEINSEYSEELNDEKIFFNPSYHHYVVNNYYEKRMEWSTSNLGSILFINKTSPADSILFESKQNKTFVILVWKYWKWLENRHVKNFNNKRKNDPLSDCSVNNCKFSGDDELLSSADAVVVHIQKGIFPNSTNRNPKQRWIFLNDESPLHAFSMAKVTPKLSNLANIFNWSMTYRSDSDVPVPYGRTVPLQKPLAKRITYDNLISAVPYWNNKTRDVLATILMSNCGVPRRMNYLNELKKHLNVDVYGSCSKDHKNSCPGHFQSDCDLMSKYFFYLVFENSLCDEYLTEKIFYHAYGKGAIPIIMGSTVDKCDKLLPPDSFLHVDNYKSPEELAQHVIDISKDDRSILSYHRWRNDFEAVNEHGYFGSRSYHLCRICEALNYNDSAEKVYDEEKLRIFLDPDLSCH